MSLPHLTDWYRLSHFRHKWTTNRDVAKPKAEGPCYDWLLGVGYPTRQSKIDVALVGRPAVRNGIGDCSFRILVPSAQERGVAVNPGDDRSAAVGVEFYVVVTVVE